MATATVEKTTSKLDDLILTLGEGEMTVQDALAKFGEGVLSAAWAQGCIEFGRSKYVTSGNLDVPESRPTLILEDGIEWSGPKKNYHGRVSAILSEKLPECRFYQKYQREVCVNKERDIWEWAEASDNLRGKDVRWARRDVDRSEIERSYKVLVRLTEKGLASLSN